MDESPVEVQLRIREAHEIGPARNRAWFVLALLAVQSALGMFLNLYVVVNGYGFWGVLPFIFATPVLIAHSVNMLLIGTTSAVSSVFVFRIRDRTTRTFTLTAMLSVAVAAQAGFFFVATGNNVYSFEMEMAFLGVLFSQIGILTGLWRWSHRDSASVSPSPSAA